jgi:hypothetical protein
MLENSKIPQYTKIHFIAQINALFSTKEAFCISFNPTEITKLNEKKIIISVDAIINKLLRFYRSNRVFTDGYLPAHPIP